MGKNRLEAFSDGVLAIVITIMVLEIKVPHGTDLQSVLALLPILMSYILSFIYIGIYWNNHHHMIQTCRSINGSILWANLHLLFWLSLVPFTTGFMGENHFASLPTLLYGFVLLMAAIAYWLLQATIVHSQGENSILKKAIGKDWKGKLSPVIYIIAVVSAYWLPWVSITLYSLVALMWIVPDRRIEKMYLNSKV